MPPTPTAGVSSPAVVRRRDLGHFGRTSDSDLIGEGKDGDEKCEERRNVQLSSCDAHPEAQIRKNKEEVYEWV